MTPEQALAHLEAARSELAEIDINRIWYPNASYGPGLSIVMARIHIDGAIRRIQNTPEQEPKRRKGAKGG